MVVIQVAMVFLALCLATFWWGTRPSAVGIRHTLFVFAWLCAALTAALVTFSLFPTSAADGKVLGVTLGGAGAFVFLVWTAAIRAGNQAAGRDATELQAVRHAEADAKREAAKFGLAPSASILTNQRTYWYEMRDSVVGTKPWIGIITGDLRHVRGVDAWVNSENTDMMMARTHDYAVSGIIRYEGARRDETGRILDDVIADELAAAVRGRRPVAPGVAIVTSSGELHHSHGVRFLIHAAAVEGQPGAGYRPIRDLNLAVAQALTAAASPGIASPAESVLLPLLGAGTGGASLDTIAGTVLTAAIEHLSHTTSAHPLRTLVLAYTDLELAACQRVLDASPEVVRRERGPS